MRRTLATAVLAAGMFAAAACSGDGGSDGGDGGGGDGGGGGASTEEICADLEQSLDPVLADLSTAMQEAALAAGQGDQTAAATGVAELNELVGEVTGVLQDNAAKASDQEFSGALETFAAELETLATGVATGQPPDTQALQDAGDGVAQYCGE